jgi:hypothetical protein
MFYVYVLRSPAPSAEVMTFQVCKRVQHFFSSQCGVYRAPKNAEFDVDFKNVNLPL